MSNTYKQLSQQEWIPSNGTTRDAVNAGSLQRIADAVELMAKRHQELMADLDRYKRWYEDCQTRLRRAERRIAALKGATTRLRKSKQVGASAVAPELLAALKEVVSLSDRKHNAWDKAHAVIAQAEGRE